MRPLVHGAAVGEQPSMIFKTRSKPINGHHDDPSAATPNEAFWLLEEHTLLRNPAGAKRFLAPLMLPVNRSLEKRMPLPARFVSVC
jgi:hypothetical protein